MHILRLLWVLLLVCWSKQVDAEPGVKPKTLDSCIDELKVKTTQGSICGTYCPGCSDVCGEKYKTNETRMYKAFGGIPFAKPPVNTSRFQIPTPGDSWDGYRDGSWMPPMCPQLNLYSKEYEGEEDCLFLNVYVPEESVQEKDFPVMVYIHGGAFSFGGVQDLFADKLMTRDVILVTIQYRLGILGFLSTGDDVAPGNLALKDQELALNWVQDNIEKFGGDKNKVTIFGESAGAVSVHLQMLNPKAEGLFSRAIMQSGTALMPLFRKINHQDKALEVANKLNCSITRNDIDYSSEKIIKCLQDITDSSKFVQVIKEFNKVQYGPVPYSLRYGEATIPDVPEKLLRKGNYHYVDVIMGINQNEGGFITKNMFHLSREGVIEANLSCIRNFFLNMDENNTYVVQQMLQYYLGGDREYSEDDADKFTEMFGDYVFNIPHDYSLGLHLDNYWNGKKLYAYELNHKGVNGFLDTLSHQIGKHYVNHGEDTVYLFKPNRVHGQDNKTLESIILDLWTNFTTHGNPTPDRSLGFTWAPVTLESTDHLVLRPQPYMEPDTRSQRRKFMSYLNITMNQAVFPGEEPLLDWLENERFENSLSRNN